jgi:hypothetical protein
MAKPHKINFDEPALRALDAQKLRNFRLSIFESNKQERKLLLNEQRLSTVTQCLV